MDKKVWVILASAILCQWTHALPVPEEDDSLISNRTETSMTAGEEKKDGKAISPVSRLPTSPVDLLRPDKISFYTFDSNGQVVLKRMTEKEIQSLIAAGGGQLPVAISEPQKIS
ncbi:GSCOCG00013461001-RA-CDS, partial [Cotesia congregata]